MGTSDWDFYASDCLDRALCLSARGRELIWGYSCVRLRGNYRRQDEAALLCALLWENLELLRPFIVAAKRQYSLYSSSEAGIVPSGGNLCSHSSRSRIRPFFGFFFLRLCLSVGINRRGGLWSSAHDLGLISFLRSAFTLR